MSVFLSLAYPMIEPYNINEDDHGDQSDVNFAHEGLFGDDAFLWTERLDVGWRLLPFPACNVLGVFDILFHGDGGHVVRQRLDIGHPRGLEQDLTRESTTFRRPGVSWMHNKESQGDDLVNFNADGCGLYRCLLRQVEEAGTEKSEIDYICLASTIALTAARAR